MRLRASAYILHARSYRDTSLLLDCFTDQHGLLTLVAKGARRPRSPFYACLQPFIFLEIAWVGKGDLKTLTQAESVQRLLGLSGSKILLGFYLNELLMRLLPRFDPLPSLFQAYQLTLEQIALTTDKMQQQLLLRYFELQLLAGLGYGLDLTKESKSEEEISPDLLYHFEPNQGLIETADPNAAGQLAISGASLIALRQKEVVTEVQLKEIKKLMRFVLKYYLGNKPLVTRKLFSLNLT